MSIDNVIATLKDHRKTLNVDKGIEFCEEIEALDYGLNVMRKYQRIEQIVRWNNAPSPYYKPDGQLFREICEVLEDGND